MWMHSTVARRNALKSMRLVPSIWCLGIAFLLVAHWGEAVAREPHSRSGERAGKVLDDRGARIALVTGTVFSGSETRENMRILCDEIGGRLSGSEGAKEALNFVETSLKRYGLENVHQEPFEFSGWFRGAFRCEVTTPERVPMHALALGNTPSTPPGGVEAQVIDAAHGNPVELDRLGDSLKGKFALVVDEVMPGGRWMHRSEVMLEVSKRGAAGLLFQTMQPGQLPMTGTCWMNGVSPIPGVGISKEDGDWIRRQLARGKPVTVRLEVTNETGPAMSANVVGEIPGAGPEFVIVGAHLDAWDIGQGAVDNGTGTIVALEAARALAKAGVRPTASIRFVFFMGEESGLYGSIAYAASHETELSRCRAMMNCDMVGTPLGIRAMGHDEARPFFESLLESLKSFELTSGFSTRVGIYGDQQAFLIRGVPVVSPMSRLEDESERYYHTSADTYDKVTFGALGSGAAFVAAVALELAWPNERPVAALDEAAVKKLVHDNNLEEPLKVWGDWLAR
jgi:Iap family predicted aminopeptidase